MSPSSARPRVLVTRALFREHVEHLAAHVDVELNQADVPIAPADLATRVAGCDGLLCASGDRVDATVLADAARLRCVSTISVGTNHIDLAACSQRGIIVTNTPDVLTETTADFGWALMMAAARRVTESEHWLRAGYWQRWSLDQFLGVDVHHATLGILGMGRIGQALAHRASGFSMRVIYHNRSRLPEATERQCHARYVTREVLFTDSDHLILVLPYTPENHHIVGAAELATMKATATLTNIARGGLIDEEALADALEAGRLGGAGLDVYEGEPAINPRILALSRVALTPHLGSASRDTRRAMGMLAIDNLIDALAGREPPQRVA
ncbi:MAG: D-glycerate dehydrogenase [Burkholderiaceae bacterium]